MGNFLFRRKRIVAEELEQLQKRGEELEAQIRRSITSKQSLQWFSTVSLLFLVVISVTFSCVQVSDKGRRMIYSIFSVFAGFFLLYCFRRMTNEYYNWSIQRKINAREEIAKKKKDLLEKVKETETFKVAKEILEKYDDTAQFAEPVHPQPAPRLSLAPSQAMSSPESSFAAAPIARERMIEKLDESAKENDALEKCSTSSEASAHNEVRPVPAITLKPPRPFFKPHRSVAEKVVDFIIGDTPTDRFALICSHCYGHNGMARKEEFEFLSYRCWMCGEFNPARRQRRSMQLMQTQSEENLSSSLRPDLGLEDETPKLDAKEIKNRARTRSSSHQRPLMNNSNEKEEEFDAVAQE